MKDSNSPVDSRQDLEGGYVNHGLSESTNNVDLIHSFQSLQNTHGNHRDIQGSSDFILIEDPGDDEGKQKESLLKSVLEHTRRRAKAICTKKTLYKRLPILNWLPRYNGQDALGDLVAGITVGLTVIPQSLAYSNVAGLPPQYGLYGSFLGCFIYVIFGSCKDIPMGPTAIISLLTYQTVSHLDSPVPYAILLTFLVGIVELIMGIFGLGFLIDFVSGPVSSGFTSAVALIIATSQVKDILGIPAKGSQFIEMWQSIGGLIHQTSAWDVTLGVSCIALLLILRLLASWKIGPKKEELRTTKHRVVNKIIWLISTSRNALLVVICGLLGWSFHDNSPVRLIGYIPGGMPAVQIPPFGFTKDDNTTVTFIEMLGNLGSGIVVLPLISLMEDIAICKAFANGKSVDATQELIAIGVSNIGNSFVQAFPGTGSLSRSAVNNASGVRTPLGGIYTGVLVILALQFLTPYFSFIPRASLAAIIIAAVIFMVEVKVVKPMWRTKKSDLIPGVGTFIACLVLQLEIGILCGIGINILFILYHAARPKISVEKLKTHDGIEYLMLTPDRCLIFPSVDYVRNLVTKYSRRAESGSTPVVIDCSHIYGADFTAATVIEILTKDFASRGQPLFFYNLKPSVYAVFEGVEPTDFVVYYNQETLDDLLKEKGYMKQVK
ncbi:PREDICTED: sodium-independent sulfate anion transporter [Wasmannia auropunctata]|uniref:sodium-independent sulfate anion transporter n=1 Tax=Wasmannia auropunctata TaxID=64793 RepID=UPI0005EF9A61|nr:PREDICTED: sodium-independent sulfate anion transporter [Wasmannia auropunctata]XP_011689518.1 PREDICTED: sodium-independent sulfate anion transporter [Wasmannia auropunctata]XP_011689519.1 PREDICTED: sodium-independent sulfate anion transporter [Wasmannia auropunctata]XP_011689520.1 PREDICTED: sodium-independent sulfate anion transporter [Wasmannia auropunctata]